MAGPVGLSEVTVRAVLHRWNASGPAGLTDGREDNRSEPRLTTRQRDALYAALQRRPPDGGVWTGPKVARYVYDRWHVTVGPVTGWRWLRDLGFTLQVPRPIHPRAADILGQDGYCGSQVRRQLGGLLRVMRRERTSAGPLACGVDHFVKVSRSYWPGPFACYEVAELPRTNNDLEQAYGSHRYHERRASGRMGSSPSLVLRGSAKLLAGLATRRQEVTAEQLSGADRAAWQAKRAELEQRRERRTDRRRFRRDSEAYLRNLEDKLNQSRLRT